MNSNSYETQQNVYSQQEHRKIAQIYQRMLLGDKSALSNLQKIKIKSPKQSYSDNNNFNEEQQNEGKDTNEKGYSVQQNMSRKQQSRNYIGGFTAKQSPKKMNENSPKTLQKQFSSIDLVQNDQSKNGTNSNQKQKFRNYIKKKVNQLRSQKQIMKNKQQIQLADIKTVKSMNQKVQIGKVSQSKSYDLVKKKVNYNKNLTNIEIFPIQEESRLSKYEGNQSVKNTVGGQDTPNKFRKVQSSNNSKVSKNLPPLVDKKRIPTQNSQRSRNNNQKLTQKRQITTPINLANSNIKVELVQYKQRVKTRTNKDNQTQLSKQKSFSNNQSNVNSVYSKASKKDDPNKSRAKKISLPQMRRQREQFYLINEQQKRMQADIVQYHKQTVGFVQQIKKRYSLNFKNENRLKQIKDSLQVQPVLMKLEESKVIKSQKAISNSTSNKQSNKNKQEKSIQKSIQGQTTKKKKNFDVLQEKIQSLYKDNKLIDEVILKKRREVSKIDERLDANLVVQYWKQHDLQTYDFEDSVDNIPEVEIENAIDSSQVTQSRTNEAYSTAMANAKDKNWKWKVIKQYDTNRSFQEYAKSRSQLKQSKLLQNKLNRIEQNEDQFEQNGNNKVVVNSRLKNLLLL